MEKISVSIMGITGIVGNKFLQIIGNHPYFEINRVYASEQSSGRKIRETLKVDDYSIRDDILDLKIEHLNDKIFNDGSELIFSSLPTEIAREFEMKLAEKGKKVITNSSAFRMHPKVPILIPEVNPHHLSLTNGNKGFIIANGNCSTIGLVLSMAPLRSFVQEIVLTTQQSVSGAGYPGVASWDILSNIVPYIEKEEDKLENETKKILGDIKQGDVYPSPIEVYPTALRVPTRESHMGSVTLKLKEELGEKEIKELYENFRYEGRRDKLYLLPEKTIIIRNEKDRPQPELDYLAGNGISKGMSVVVGRFRIKGNRVSYIFLVNNLIRGAAGSSVLNGEFIVQEGYF